MDLLTVGHAGMVLWLDQGERFSRRALDVRLPDGAVTMAVAAGDYDRDGEVDLYLSLFVAPKLFRSPVFNDPSHAKPNLLPRGVGGLEFQDVTDAVTGGLQNTFTASFVDLEGDGWLDWALAQDTGEAEILHDRRDGRNDVLWANMEGLARAYLNRSEGRFVAVRLPDAPGSIYAPHSRRFGRSVDGRFEMLEGPDPEG